MKNKTLVVSICLFISIASIFAGGLYFNSLTRYNNNPDVSMKIVGSNDLMTFRLPVSSVKDMTGKADLIIVGTVLSKPVDKTIEFPFPNEELKQQALKHSKESPKLTISCSQIKIEEILYGQSSSDVITLGQLGKSSSDSGETKVKNGDKMLFILEESEIPGVYATLNAEESLFTINQKGNTKSLSDNKFVSRYDGIDLKILKEDIFKTKNNEK